MHAAREQCGEHALQRCEMGLGFELQLRIDSYNCEIPISIFTMGERRPAAALKGAEEPEDPGGTMI